MRVEDLLAEGVLKDIIRPEQANALRELAATPNGDLNDKADNALYASGEDEPVRLVGGGNDVFVTIGVLLLMAGSYFALTASIGAGDTIIYLVFGAFSWAVAEFITRQKRMKLASTVLAVIFIFCIGQLLFLFISDRYNLQMPENLLQLMAMRGQISLIGLLFFGGIIIASVIYFWRFKVPFLAAIVALCLTALFFLHAALFLYDNVLSLNIQITSFDQLMALISKALYMPLVCGIVIFSVAVFLDIKDRERVTIWSDCAFWLHVISAPLLVHPLFILATGQDVVFGQIEPDAMATVLLFLLIGGFFYVALAIDRRSLLIPTLAYFGSLGIYYLVSSTANNTGIPPFALILLAIGSMIIIFGAGWQHIRNIVIRPTLPTFVLNKLPLIKA